MATALRAVLLVLLCGGAAHAVECAVPVGAVPELGAIPADARLGFIRRELKVAAHRSRLWSYSWKAIYGAGALGELSLGLFVSPSEARIDNWVGTGAAVLGLAAVTVLPPKTIADENWLEARIARLPNADPCAHLADAERLLERDAEADEKGKAPLLHVANFLVNIAGGLIVGLVANRWPSALIQIFVGSAIGETTIVSRPIDSVDALARYRRGQLAERSAPRVMVAPSLARDQYGLALSLTF